MGCALRYRHVSARSAMATHKMRFGDVFARTFPARAMWVSAANARETTALLTFEAPGGVSNVALEVLSFLMGFRGQKGNDFTGEPR